MKALLVLISLHFLTANVWAGPEDQLPVESEIAADLVCGDKGGAIHINTVTEQLWQAELESKTGLVLAVTEFTRMRCPDCYDIRAELEMWGQVVNYKIEVRRELLENADQPKYEIKAYVVLTGKTEDGQTEEKWQWTCRRTSK